MALILLVGIVTRASYVDGPQLFRDEAASWYLAAQPLGSLLKQSSHETFPPLYVLLLKAWMTLLGESEAALRSFSVVAGVGIVLVTWRWARDAVGNAAALVAASLVALSPALALASRDARMYSLETLFAVSAWWTLWLLISRASGWPSRAVHLAAVALLLLVAGEVWTMSLGIPTAGLQFAFALVALLYIRTRASLIAAVCVLIGTLSLAPWMPNLLSVASTGQSFWTTRPDLASLAETLGAWFLGDLGGFWVLGVGLACACALFGLWSLAHTSSARPGKLDAGHPPQERDPQADRLLVLALLFGVGLVPAVWAYSQFRSIYDPRYLGGAFPPLAIAAGAGVEAIARRAKAWLNSGRVAGRLLPFVSVLLVVPVIVPMAVGSADVVAASRNETVIEPGRQVVRELAELVRPGDVVITLNAQTFFPLEYYLVASGEAKRLGVGLYDWHRPSAAFFTGWQDIDSASIVDAAKVAHWGWAGAVHLAPGGSLWCVSLVDPGYEYPLFAPLQSGQLREIQTLDIQSGAFTAQIREAVPIGASSP